MVNHEPFLLGNGNEACLLIHGFSGSPAEMRGLGEALAAQGLTVLGVRLAGHGGSPEELAAANRHDWLLSAESGLTYLKRHFERVHMVGFSLGGALAMQLAVRYPVEQLALLATPLALQGDWRVNLLAVVRHVMPWFYPFERADFSDPLVRNELQLRMPPELNLDDPQVQAALRKEARISVAAIDECRQALAAGRNCLKQISVPTLVMHGRQDVVAAPASAQTIYDTIAARQKELVWWEHTGHQLLLLGPHRTAIYARVARFLLSNQPAAAS